MKASGFALALILAAGGASAAYLVVDSGYFPDITSLWQNEAKVYPAPNVERKADRSALSTLPPEFRFNDPANDPSVDPLRQSFAAIDAMTNLRQEVQPPVLDALPTPMPRPRPRSILRRQQSSYTLLSDLQIDAIKTRLRLTAVQEAAWPPVEVALRNLAQRIQDARRSGGGLAGAEEVEQFKAAAAPFFSKLTGDQKRELKMLAHIIGLGTVVAML